MSDTKNRDEAADGGLRLTPCSLLKWVRVTRGIYRVGRIRVVNRRKEDAKDYWCVITSDPMASPEITHSRHRLLSEAKAAAVSLANAIGQTTPTKDTK